MRFASFVLLCACGGGQTPGPDAPPVDPRQTVAEVPVTLNRNLDLLFVIDDSGSMADKQQNLADNFPNFINVLNMVTGGLPDLHLGVVSTDMGTKTSGSPTPAPGVGTLGQGGCADTGKDGQLLLGLATGVTGNFISDIKLSDGTRQQNYAGNNLAQTFGQMARLGATGCGFEQPLAAMQRALDGNPANAGFLRPDAALAVLFLTDEDDCSVKDGALFGPENATVGPQQSFRCTRFGVTCTEGGNTTDEMNAVGVKSGCTSNASSTLIDDVGGFRDFLAGLKSEPRKVVVGGIIGDPEPFAVELRSINGTQLAAVAHSCSSAGVDGILGTTDDEVADPGVRMQAFFDQFPGRSTRSTICQDDFSTPLLELGRLIKFAIGSPCIDGTLADIDPNTPGVQPDCIVEDLVGDTATPIQPCPGSTCWQIVSDAFECPGGDNLRLDITRASTPDPTTVTRMRCLVE